MGLILPGDDLHDVAGLVQGGDALIGWRGDPTMDVYVWPEYGTVAVYGFDRGGVRYLAAQESLSNPGWRHDLLRRLRDGDYQRGDDVFADIEKKNAAAHKAADDKWDEFADEQAEKLAWALRRDVGVYVDGRSRDFYPVGGN